MPDPLPPPLSSLALVAFDPQQAAAHLTTPRPGTAGPVPIVPTNSGSPAEPLPNPTEPLPSRLRELLLAPVGAPPLQLRPQFLPQFDPQALANAEQQNPPTTNTTVSWCPSALAAALESLKANGCPLCLEEGRSIVANRTPVAILITTSTTTTTTSADNENHCPKSCSKAADPVYHAFCQSCIFRWFVTRRSCPLCRLPPSGPILLAEDLYSASGAASRCASAGVPSAELFNLFHQVHMRESTWRWQAVFYCFAAEVIARLGFEDWPVPWNVPDPRLEGPCPLVAPAPTDPPHRRPRWITFDRYAAVVLPFSAHLQADLVEAGGVGGVPLPEEEGQQPPPPLLGTLPWLEFSNEASGAPREHLITYYRCFLHLYGYRAVVEGEEKKEKKRGVKRVIDDVEGDEGEGEGEGEEKKREDKEEEKKEDKGDEGDDGGDEGDGDNDDDDDDEDEDDSSAEDVVPSTLAAIDTDDQKDLVPTVPHLFPEHFFSGVSRMKALDFFVEDLRMLSWIFPLIDYVSHSPPPGRGNFIPEPIGRNLTSIFHTVDDLLSRAFGEGRGRGEGPSSSSSSSPLEFTQNAVVGFFARRYYFPSFASKEASSRRFAAMYDDFLSFAELPYESHQMFLLSAKFELKK
ncbi:hypothetical protein TYRP_003022 [Tyrophagus putrescentiae]|nr:hypothetical protein TYRP_003022 [Tyrophagus putrescentiae]